jgi:hypothetical protein
MARELVKFHYKDAFDSGIDTDHNSDQRDEAISEKIKKLIGESLFLQGPLDAEVSFFLVLAVPLILHKNRAALKILVTLGSSISSDGFIIVERSVYRIFSLMLSRPVRKPALQWLVLVYVSELSIHSLLIAFNRLSTVLMNGNWDMRVRFRSVAIDISLSTRRLWN